MIFLCPDQSLHIFSSKFQFSYHIMDASDMFLIHVSVTSELLFLKHLIIQVLVSFLSHS